MNIDSINNGTVIDHITPGRAMELFDLLHLSELECPVALIMNASSRKKGRKDILKIDGAVELNLDIIGYVDPGATVNIIKNGKLVEKLNMDLPLTLTNVLKCKNPRCISTVEQELDHIFKLTDKEDKVYRCLYCEAKHYGENDE